jgi:20S proteasome subunit beta 7
MYKRRSDFNPLWNMMLVAGLDETDSPFLASVDLLGTTFSAPTLATGFGAHLAQPLLRKLMPNDEDSVKDVTKEQAVHAVKECMKVLFYRDARSLDKYSLAVITKEGVELTEDMKLENQSWAFADQIRVSSHPLQRCSGKTWRSPTGQCLGGSYSPGSLLVIPEQVLTCL